MNLTTLIIRQFNRQVPDPTYADLIQLGRAIEWRTELRDALPVTRSINDPSTSLRMYPFPYLIQRQIEDELDSYQSWINSLSDDLQISKIDEDEFQRRLRNLTIAILLLAFLRGSQRSDEEMSNQALEVLQSGGLQDIEPDWSQFPPEAAESLQAEIEQSILSSANLGGEIMAGKYEDRAGSLASRLALWATTALGVYALGQLWREDGETRLVWRYGPTDHCSDCQTLNGQVHTIAEWNAFYLRTGKRPQSHLLRCGGWACQCGTYETDEPVSGNFV